MANADFHTTARRLSSPNHKRSQRSLPVLISMCLFTLETGNKEIATVETAIICSLIFEMRVTVFIRKAPVAQKEALAEDGTWVSTDHINSANASLAIFLLLKDALKMLQRATNKLRRLLSGAHRSRLIIPSQGLAFCLRSLFMRNSNRITRLNCVCG